MTILTILEFPDPRLRTKARPVKVVDDRIKQLIEDMLETMYDAKGIGLAATQVDVHERVVVMDLSEDRNQPMVFINPEVTVLDDAEAPYDEGCLSVPGYYETVNRPANILLKSLDREGNPFEMKHKFDDFRKTVGSNTGLKSKFKNAWADLKEHPDREANRRILIIIIILLLVFLVIIDFDLSIFFS